MSDRGAKEPRICFVVTSPAVVNLLGGDGPDAMGGAELQLYLLARELRHRNWGVSFLVGDYGQGNIAYTAEGIQLVTGHPGRKLQDRAWGRSYAAWRLWRTLQSIDADIYISRGLVGQAGVIASYCRLKGRKYVFWFGKNADAWYSIRGLSPLPFWERLAASYGIRNADLVIVQTNDQNRLLKKHVRREGMVVPNASPWQSTLESEPADYVLWVGSIQPKKRPELMLDLAARMPDVQFVMAGGEMASHAKLYRAVESRAQRLTNVEFLGFVRYQHMKKLFRRARLFVSTSNGKEEGFPNVFLQAWSCGVPTVATCDPDGVIAANGLGFHCSEISEVEDSIATVLGNAQLRSQLARQARKYVAEYHSLEAVGSKLNRVLRELLRSSK